MHRLRLIWLLIFLSALFAAGAGMFLLPSSALAQEVPAQPGKQVIVVFLDGLSFADLERLRQYPHVQRGLGDAYYAALTIRSPGSRNDANGYLLMGSGGPALYTSSSGTVYHRWERLVPAGVHGETTAEERMSQLRGGEPAHWRTAPPELLYPGIYRLYAYNADRPFTARIGLLGSALQEAGIAVSLYGNGDTSEEPRRHAALFAINRDGEIPYGDISARTIERAAGYPDGIRTRYSYLLERIKQDNAGLIVVQIADLDRLYQLKEDLAPDHFARQYERILADLDRFLGALLEWRSAEQMLLVTSPAVNPVAAKEKSLLTPLLLWKGNDGGGELVSLTTRQRGLVSGVDVLPTILSWLSVPLPEGVVGHVMTGIPAQREAAVFSSLQAADDASIGSPSLFTAFLAEIQEIDRIYDNRPRILYAYVMLQIAILLAATFVWMWQKNGKRPLAAGVRRVVRLALLAMLFFPSLFLAEPLFGWKLPAPAIFALIVMGALGGALLVEQWRLPRLLLTVAGLTVCAILLDGFTGGAAMRRSYLGYDPVIGARFYGLGNEYEGVLIGAAVLAVASLYEWRKRQHNTRLSLPFLFALGGFALVLFYMAAPWLGTNAGGFLAGAIAFAITLVRLEGWRIGSGGLLLCGGLLLGGSGLLIALHLSSSAPLTHVGVVANDIVSGNWGAVLQIVERKLEMNWRLIRVSSWSKMFVISLVVIGLLSLRPHRFLRRLSARYPYLVCGFSGIVAGSLAGLVLNDSGIVSAATSIVFFVAPALFAALGEGERLPAADPEGAGR